MMSTSEDDGSALPLGGRSHILLAGMCNEQQIACDVCRQHPLACIRTSTTHGAYTTHGSISNTLQVIVTCFAAAAAASKVQAIKGTSVRRLRNSHQCWACADNHMPILNIVKAKLVSCMNVGRSPLHVVHITEAIIQQKLYVHPEVLFCRRGQHE